MAVDSIRSIEITEDAEGGWEEVYDDYYFDKIGQPLPIVNNSDGSAIFDLQSPPACPLAISEVHSLIFVAHSSGFYVAKTKDVMDSAKANSSSIEELSVASVSVGKVHILSLSSDSSTLAACVGADVHFFAVDSLVQKDCSPSSSCSLDEPSATIKDMQWRRRQDTSYLVLSNQGKLYLGALGAPLKHVMDDVDAVDWSSKGKHIAVARDNNLHIFSSMFKERSRISLPLKSWISDFDDKFSVKVDSIRWIRPDSIVLGCFQQLEDGKEENYLIQVVKSQDGRITDASSKLSTVSLYDVFAGLVDDIMPSGSGPYLLLSYLQQCGIAITANRKNTDRPIALLHWPLRDDTSEVSLIDIARDTWFPRIGVQGNGDDNLILGLCVDNVSVQGKVRVEEKELAPSCALFYVTLEGKLVMYYLASVSEPTVSPEVDSSLCDDEEDSSADVAGGKDQLIPFSLGEQSFDQVGLGSQLKDMRKLEPNMSKDNGVFAKKDIIHAGKSENSMTAVVPNIFSKDATRENQDMKSFANTKASIADGKEKVPVSELYLGAGLGIDVFGQHRTKLEQSSLKSPLEQSSNAEAKKLTEFKPPPVAFLEQGSTFPSQFRGKGLEESPDMPKTSLNQITTTTSQYAASQPGSFGNIPIFSGGSDSRPHFGSISSQGIEFSNAGNSFHTGFVSPPLDRKPFLQKDSIRESPSTTSSVRQNQVVGPKASGTSGKIESLPSIRSLQVSSQETFDFGRPTNYRSQSSKEPYRALSTSSSEPHLSRQFGNIKEMTSELDALLGAIEKPGGFKDVCTVSKRSSVEALEEQMKTLSRRCQMWKSLMEKQLGETQNLLDKTVQVLARKIYIDGIVKQATDSKYWELWNRQKLNSEFELKRRHLLKLNQVLTNQLIELERHFNTLELHKFAENAGVHPGRKTFHGRYEPSRQVQSLHSLHNTTNSQVAAAEQLSECLTKQMEVLSICSPVKQKNVKQELFESIGIPYDPSFSSPVTSKVHDSSLAKKSLVSGSAVNKSQSRRRLSSAMKNSDSDNARRRESLDESWARLEPTKTTIKRVLLQSSQKTGMNTLSGNSRDKLDLSHVDRPARLTSPSSFMNQFGNEGIQNRSPAPAFETKSNPYSWGGGSLPPSQLTTQDSRLKSPMLPSSTPVLPSVLASEPVYTAGQTGSFAADKSSHTVYSFGKPGNILTAEPRSFQQSEAASLQKPSFSTDSAAQIPKSSDFLSPGVKGNVLTNATVDTKGVFSKLPSKSYDSPLSLQTAAAPAIKSQPSGKFSSAQGFSMSFSVPSSPMMNPSPNVASTGFNLSSSSSMSAAMPFGVSMGSSKTDTSSNQTVSSTPSSAASSPGLQSSSFSLQPGSSKMPSPADTTRSLSTSESLKTEVQLPPATTPQTPLSLSDSSEPLLQPATVKSSPTPDTTPTVEIEPPKPQMQHFADKVSPATDGDKPPGFSFKIEAPVSSSPISETSTALEIESAAPSPLTIGISASGSGSQPSLNDAATPATGFGLNTQPKLPPDANSLSSVSQTNDSSAAEKSANMDVPAATEEDEMEEVAPETNASNDISLGGFGGFGLGSTPSPNVPKVNPFGGSFAPMGTNQASSPFTLTVPSGELFRPASFSFQPPQPAQPSPPANLGAVSGGFGSGGVSPAPTSGFGQPAQIGAGQQALGSVLGSFGQSRQFGTGIPGGFGATSSIGGFSSAPAVGGFATAASGTGGFAGLASAGGGFGGSGGFAGAASGGGGFAGAASGGGGFGAAASGGGGFAGAASGGGGFAGAASGGGFGAAPGGGFGAFSSQPGFSAFGGGNQSASGGFSSFGGSGKPPELFTQIRK